MRKRASLPAAIAILLAVATTHSAPPFALIDKKGREIAMSISCVGKKNVTGTVNAKEIKVPSKY